MSSVVGYLASSRESPDEGNDERLDFVNPTTSDLSLPGETFLKAAVSLKDQVVKATWEGERSSGMCLDPTVYTGLLGTAFTCFRSYEATGNRQDLLLCAEIADKCAAVVPVSARYVTFLCGRGGVYALGAVVANLIGDHERRDLYLNLFLEVAQEKALSVGPEEGGFGMSYDLLYGRAGFLWGALFINKPWRREVAQWHGTRYLGAANGLAGILQVLLHFPLSAEDAEDVKGTLRYMMANRFPHSGNYPSSEGNPRDKFVQWSHGAAGMAITLCKASQVFPEDREFRDAAIEAGEVVWKNGLLKKVGLADGVAGNAYAFLSLYRLTGESIYEERAKAFASFLYHNVRQLVTAGQTRHGAEHAYSLFQGLAGTACLWFDVHVLENSRFPGYEL
ncbi:hypothetical protein M0R45_005004 [Rubus argutus]|uniref:LanC-like protein GCL1 n=1 Tax=Rubus argutus TaxID=59490 RepID=A0AAW1YLK4_RUBAR